MQPIILLVVVGASIGMFFLHVQPTRGDITALQEESRTLDETLEKAREIQEVRDRLRTQMNNIADADLERLGKLLPQHVDNVRLVLEIDEMATRYDLTVADINVAEGEEITARSRDFASAARAAREINAETRSEFTTRDFNLQSIDLTFSVEAPYEKFLAFLADLEQSLRIVDVTELQFEASDDGDTYTFVVTLRTYWLQ